GPGREVAARRGDAQGAGPEPRRPRGGSDVGERYLAQLDEPGILVEPRLDGRRGERSGLIGQRRPRNAGAGAEAEDAAERFGRVVQLVAPPAVELREGGEVPEERHLGGERRAAGRHRRALERIRVT